MELWIIPIVIIFIIYHFLCCIWMISCGAESRTDSTPSMNSSSSDQHIRIQIQDQTQAQEDTKVALPKFEQLDVDKLPSYEEIFGNAPISR